MSVRMVGIGRLDGDRESPPDDERTEDVSHRFDRVRNQGVGTAENSANELGCCQAPINENSQNGCSDSSPFAGLRQILPPQAASVQPPAIAFILRVPLAESKWIEWSGFANRSPSVVSLDADEICFRSFRSVSVREITGIPRPLRADLVRPRS